MKAATNDIISDAAATADPRRAEAGRHRIGSRAGFGKDEFRDLISANGRSAQKLSGKASSPALATRGPSSEAVADDPVGAAYRALGAVLLHKTFEKMLPDQGGIVAGRDAAPSIWKSMLAQQLADSISASVFRRPGSLDTPEQISSQPVPE